MAIEQLDMPLKKKKVTKDATEENGGLKKVRKKKSFVKNKKVDEDGENVTEDGGPVENGGVVQRKKKKQLKKKVQVEEEEEVEEHHEDEGETNRQHAGSASTPTSTTAAATTATTYSGDVIQSLEELLELCQRAKEQKWTRTRTPASIRKGLGFPIRKKNISRDLGQHLKTLYLEFVGDIGENEDGSDYLQPLFECTKEEPDAAYVILQFLYYADINQSDPDMKVIADLIAKNTFIGGWCREVLSYPNEFDDAILEYSLAHLEKITHIIDPQERLNYVLEVILRANDDPVAGFNKLRVDLVNVVSREGGAGCMTVTRALYFHNSIEVMLFGKNDENPLLDDTVDVFENALDACHDSFPSDLLFQNALDQLSPCCSYTFCFKRGPFPCCDLASYCCQKCRDDDWKRHRKECDNGIDNKVEIPFDVSVEEVPEETEDMNELLGFANNTEDSKPPEPKTNDADEEVKKTPPEPSSALIYQGDMLDSHPGIEYFLFQEWGNLALQLTPPFNEEFRNLRSAAPSSNAAVKDMCNLLVVCCPYLEKEIRHQLEEEYGVDLGG